MFGLVDLHLKSRFKIIHTDRGIPKITMGRSGKFDPHIWLDPYKFKSCRINI